MALVLASLALVGFRGPGCGGGGGERAGVYGPCTRDKDCEFALRCAEGVCLPEDAGTDAAPDVRLDAGSDVVDSSASDANEAAVDGAID